MLLPITYPSSAEFWLDGSLHNNLEVFALGKRIPIDLPEDFCFAVTPWDAHTVAQKLGLKTPLYLFSTNASDRGYRASYITRVHSNPLPPQSFVNVGKVRGIDVFMTSPEYTFFEAARYLSFVDLVVLGTELCASYIYDSGNKYNQRRRTPVCSAGSITEFLGKALSERWVKRALRAAHYILDGSNSPVETRMAILAVLPPHKGGYGLPRPVLNGDIILTEEGRKALGYKSMRCDMVWEALKIVIEYDSRLGHSGSQQIDNDVRRYNALMLSGYKFFRISAEIYNDLNELDVFFAMVRCEMGLRNGSRLSLYKDRRKLLYDSLKISRVFSGFKFR